MNNTGLIAAALGFFITVGAIAQSSDASTVDAVGGTERSIEQLDVRQVIDLILESDPSIGTSERTVGIARSGYEQTRAATLPNVDLTISPYSFDQRRIPGGSGEIEQTTHSAGVGVSVQQVLPTSGSLVASIDHQLRLVDGADESIEQVPEFVVALEQPLFVNGNVIDTSVFRAGLRSAEISVEQAALSDRLTRNRVIDSALSLYVQVAALRRSVDLLRQTVAILDRQIESARLDREQGLISDNALLALQVSRNNRRETLFDTELALLSTEQALARTIGVSSFAGIGLDDRFEPLPLPTESSIDELLMDNPERAIEELSLERASEQTLLNEITDRPQLSLSFRTTPLYPESRSNPDDLSTSISDYFEDGAGWETSLAVELTVPLVTRREREARERIDTLTQEQALISVDDTARQVANALQTLLAERRFLTERLTLLETDIEYEEQRVENERTLLDAGVSTQLALDEVELDLTSRRNEAWEAQASLYLNGLEILATTGHDLAEQLR